MSDLSEADVQRIASAITNQLAQNGQHIGHDQMSNIAAAAARTAVQEMAAKSMALLGIDPANSKHIEALKANIAFIQRWRIWSENIGRSVSNAIANALVIGIIAIFVLGFLVWTRSGATPHTTTFPHQ